MNEGISPVLINMYLKIVYSGHQRNANIMQMILCYDNLILVEIFLSFCESAAINIDAAFYLHHTVLYDGQTLLTT